MSTQAGGHPQPWGGAHRRQGRGTLTPHPLLSALRHRDVRGLSVLAPRRLVPAGSDGARATPGGPSPFHTWGQDQPGCWLEPVPPDLEPFGEKCAFLWAKWFQEISPHSCANAGLLGSGAVGALQSKGGGREGQRGAWRPLGAKASRHSTGGSSGSWAAAPPPGSPPRWVRG